MDKIAIGKRLKDLRNSQNLTLEKMADIVNASNRSTVKNWEDGRTIPRHQYLEKYANYFNVSIDWILYGNYKNYVVSTVKKAIKSNNKTEWQENFTELLNEYFNDNIMNNTEHYINKTLERFIYTHDLASVLEISGTGYNEQNIIRDVSIIVEALVSRSTSTYLYIYKELQDLLQNLEDINPYIIKRRQLPKEVERFINLNAEKKAINLHNELVKNYKKFYDYYTKTIDEINEQYKDKYKFK